MLEYLKRLVDKTDSASSKNFIAVLIGITTAIGIFLIILSMIVLKQNHDTTLSSLLSGGVFNSLFHHSE